MSASPSNSRDAADTMPPVKPGFNSSTTPEHPIEYWEARLLGKKVHFETSGEEVPKAEKEKRRIKIENAFVLILPREIREYIIEQVLCGCHTPPTYPSKSGRIDFHDIIYKAWRSRTKIYHEQRGTHCPSNCLPLLLTSRQIHDETQCILNRKNTKSTYVLNISVLNDYDLFPTWISVPYITNRVYALYTDVHLFGSIIPSKIARRLVGDGGRLGFHWSFYALLERFLRYGPVGEKKGKRNDSGNLISDQIELNLFQRGNLNFDDRDITVEILTLDFQSAEPMLPFPPDNIGYGAWQGQHHAFDLIFDETNGPSELEQYRTRPEWLAKYLLLEIHALLTMSYHFASYGKMLYERIGTIRIVSPEGVTEIDLATRLAALRFTNQQDTFGDVWPPEERLSTFWKWKKQTLARRQELGFPVVWPHDPELKG
ncbi:hypothetical protein N7474_003796 [Penicillium riverlandense]|uniref:uncharacterized protein n=1 Tax=Penicillium riverlandense TaxID=1903569 RepID=UPI0025468E49|nr:uncharacterized protein N7474_003796 [Penicillium riverlandense]KAJ5818205.1 hypothetical protein N7474_003796 [Penicillium riverlandense]